MPSEALKSMAEKHGVSIDDAERYWKEAIDSAESKGKTGDDKYRYAMGIVRKRMTSSAIEESATLRLAIHGDNHEKTNYKRSSAKHR